MRKCFTLFLLVFAFARGYAQVTTGTLTGIVKDVNGEVLEGATVVATYLPSRTVYNTLSGPDGQGGDGVSNRYTVTNLVYIPTDASQFVAFQGQANRHFQIVTPGQQYKDLKTFLADNADLAQYAGKNTPRNGFALPWENHYCTEAADCSRGFRSLILPICSPAPGAAHMCCTTRNIACLMQQASPPTRSLRSTKPSSTPSIVIYGLMQSMLLIQFGGRSSSFITVFEAAVAR